MTYSNIIAVLSGASDDQLVLEAAARLAMEGKGVVRVILSLPVAAARVWAEAVGATQTASRQVALLADQNAQVRARCAELLRATASELGMGYGDDAACPRLQMASETDVGWPDLIREGTMADLLLISKSVLEREGLMGGIAADALVTMRLPMLIINGPSPVLGCIVAIAWDGSPSAGRAVRGAMPLLKVADSVVIIQDTAGVALAERAAADPRKLKTELERRGVGAVTIVLTDKDREGNSLLSAVTATGAKLIVSGAFGHTRLGERIFGGVTRTLLKAPYWANHFLSH